MPRLALTSVPTWVLGLCAALAVSGCGGDAQPVAPSAAAPPAVRVVHADPRTISKTVGQPGFIEAYERTSIYPKLAGYIEKWSVDIGDKVAKGETLATLFIPELTEDFKTKQAVVDRDKRKVMYADAAVKVALADVKAAEARLGEVKASYTQFQSQADRWEVQVARLSREVGTGVVDSQVLLESQNQLRASTASREAARAAITKAEADLESRKAAATQAFYAQKVAQADLAVSVSDEKRVQALTGYMTLAAPFTGTIVARNANTFDFVQPVTGDPTADARAPYLSPSGAAAPIYVVDRTDIVRVFVDIPEGDARYVGIGNKSSVLVRAYRDQPIPGSVTRTSWALNVKSRTLRAEIDLPNTDRRLLPGMYAYGYVHIERPNVRAIPTAALVYRGAEVFCWLYDKGKSLMTEVRTGISDGEWMEVTSRRVPGAVGDAEWVPFTGAEEVILGDLSVLLPDGKVRVAADKK